MASLASPPRFSVAARERGRVTLTSPDGAVALISVLEDDIVRVSVLPDGTWNFRKTWAIAPGADDVATEGRDRLDLSGFTLPQFAFDDDGETLCIETRLYPPHRETRRPLLRLGDRARRRIGCAPRKIARPRPTISAGGTIGVHHYLVRDPAEKYFGLGETQRRHRPRRPALPHEQYSTRMGYGARTSDPLYKHIPFYIT